MGMWERTAVSRLPVSGIYAPETADFRLTPVKTEGRTRERSQVTASTAITH